MRNNNTIKLLKLQGKNINIDKEVIDEKNNTAIFYISKNVVETQCPHCKSLTKRIHDYRYQKIKHTPINGYKSFLKLKKTRLLCTNCKKKFYMNYNNIVNPRYRCSNELFNSIINDLSLSLSFKNIAKKNFVSVGVVTRYLSIFSYLMQWNNITTLPKHIGIDEFKGNCDKSKYLFHIYDLDTNKTVHILRTREYTEIFNFFNKIDNKYDVEIVSMDLYAPFKNAVKDKLKRAVIIADRFHYTRIIAKALDELRLKIWRNAKNEEKKYFKFLKRTLLKDIENVKPEKLLSLQERLNYAFSLSPNLKSGYELYQSFLRIKDGINYDEKCKRFKDWLDDAQSSTITEFNSAAESLLKWHKEILNSLLIVLLKVKITK